MAKVRNITEKDSNEVVRDFITREKLDKLFEELGISKELYTCSGKKFKWLLDNAGLLHRRVAPKLGISIDTLRRQLSLEQVKPVYVKKFYEMIEPTLFIYLINQYNKKFGDNKNEQ